MDNDMIWRLLTANFLLLMGIACMAVVYVLGMSAPLAGILLYASLALLGWGVVRGLFAIIDYKRTENDEE